LGDAKYLLRFHDGPVPVIMSLTSFVHTLTEFINAASQTRKLLNTQIGFKTIQLIWLIHRNSGIPAGVIPGRISERSGGMWERYTVNGVAVLWSD